MKATSFGRRHRARNSTRPKRAAPAAEPICETLEFMLRRKAALTKPTVWRSEDERVLIMQDANARIDAHRKACPICSRRQGPLDYLPLA